MSGLPFAYRRIFLGTLVGEAVAGDVNPGCLKGCASDASMSLLASSDGPYEEAWHGGPKNDGSGKFVSSLLRMMDLGNLSALSKAKNISPLESRQPPKEALYIALMNLFVQKKPKAQEKQGNHPIQLGMKSAIINGLDALDGMKTAIRSTSLSMIPSR